MRRVIGVVVLALALTAISLSADLTIPADFRTVVNDSSLIVRGLVTDVRALEVPGAGIDSIATFAVENVLKGTASGFVYVRVPGGVIGTKRFVMVGAPAFHVGQRAIVFLRPGVTDTAFRPIGLTMGVYPVQADPQTQRLVVQPPIMAGRTTDTSGAIVRGDRRRQSLSVTEFESLVRLAVASTPGQVAPRATAPRAVVPQAVVPGAAVPRAASRGGR
jgi:hypothetical protein